MDTERIDVAQRGRYATLPKQMHQSVYTLLVVDMKVPEHVLIRDVCLRMAFMTPIHAWELDRISNKEDRQIVKDKFLVPIFCEKARCPPSNVSYRIA